MRHALGTTLALLVILTGSGDGVRAAGELKSGPEPGQSLPGPFHYLNVTGPHAGNPHCLVCEFGLRPSVLVFTREIPAEKSPVTDLIQKLDEAVDRHKNTELRAGVVVLNEAFAKEQTRKESVRRLESSLRELKHVLVAVGSPAGPEAYKLNPKVDLTVLVYNNQRVVANFAYSKDQFTDKDVDAILAAVNKIVNAK
jgi:hypothetical protein